MASTLKYKKDIDGLRAIAVLLVYLFHVDFAFFKNGFIGVDIFFVISGYLITRLLFFEIQKGNFSFLQFYVRRIRRLLPMLFFTLLLVLFFAFIFYPPSLLIAVSKTTLASILYVSNFQIWNSTGYFSQNLKSVPLLHTWSLAIEEQFYLIFPFFFYWVIKIFKRGYILVLFSAFLVSVLICFNLFLDWNNLNFFFTISRGWEFLVGSLVWYLSEQNWIITIETSKKNSLSIAGITLIAISICSHISKDNYPGWATFLPVLGCGLLLLFSDDDTFIGKGLGTKYLVLTGRSSYSFYLLHFPIIIFLSDFINREFWIYEKLLLLLIILGISFLTYLFIETPFRSRLKTSTKNVFIIMLLATFSMILLGFSFLHYKGFPKRFSKEQNQLYLNIQRSPLLDSCHWDSFKDPGKACKIFNDNIRWAVLGDSHGAELSYSLGRSLEKRKQGLIELTVSGCEPALKYESVKRGNKEWLNKALNYLNASENIENVVLVFRHSFYLYGTQLINYPEAPNNVILKMNNKTPDDVLDLYWDSFKSTVSSLTSNGKKVYIISPIPELGGNVIWNIYGRKSFFKQRTEENGPNYDYYKSRNKFILNKLATEKWPSNVIIIHAFNCLSKNNQVTTISDSNSLYFDDNHLSLEGADRLVNEIMQVSNNKDFYE